MALFPIFPPAPAPVPESQVLCRARPDGGCLSFLRYHRYTSNRLREYGPFDRFIDHAKLNLNLTYEQIVGDSRYAIAFKTPLLGVIETERFDFQDMIYPFNGVVCPAPAATA
jgi:hypothetical protein